MTDAKISFKGTIQSIQPRIRLIRSFDERSHNYLGYALFIRGHRKSFPAEAPFCVGDEIIGECVPVADDRLEPVGMKGYKISPSLLDHTCEINPFEKKTQNMCN